MQPIDTVTGKAWSTVAANAKHKQMRTACRNALIARDEGRGIVDGKVYVDNTDPEDMQGRYDIDLEKSRNRHTGAEYVALIRSRWATFCSVPRSEKDFVAKNSVDDRAQSAKVLNAAAAEVEASLPDAAEEPEVESDEPVTEEAQSLETAGVE